jgi:hypothetical protein
LRSDSLDCATIIIDDNDDDEDDDLDQPTRTRRPKGPSSPPSLTNSVPLPKPPMPDEGDW